MKLVLFDIDGTLLWGDGAARRAFEGALTEVFGSPGDPRVRYDGKTDRQIARELMRAEGHDDAEIDRRLDAVVAGYLERLRREVDAGARHFERLPGWPSCSTRSSRWTTWCSACSPATSPAAPR
jgi:phosphoglycolate phosphatase-like HAD superfamily hydrolase